MNDITELTQFAWVHARAQGIQGYSDVLSRVRTDGDGPGSWVAEWSRVAAEQARAGRYLQACQCYNMARFPYVDGSARQEAQERCVDTFDQWRSADRLPLEPLDVDLDTGRVRCWTNGLSPGGRRPVLLIMGGIVSPKEQWAQALLALRRLGMAGIATELPGVGEHAARYTAESWRTVPAILDAVADRADATQAYAMAFSFGGHLALRAAVDDPRIKGVVTASAPLSAFFTDRGWHARLPGLTSDTLAHLTGVPFAELSTQLPSWRLTEQQLSGLELPVHYLVSTRDEVIPPAERDYLRRNVRQLRLVENDDLHASPRHLTATGLWAALSVLRMRRVHNPQRTALGALWRAVRLRDRLKPPPGLPKGGDASTDNPSPRTTRSA